MIQGPFDAIAFRCRRCGAEARLEPAGVACPQCHALYPERCGSIDFMGPYALAAGPDDATTARQAEAIRAALDLPSGFDGAVREAVAASRERTGVAYVDAEIAALPTRFGMEADVAADAPGPPSGGGGSLDFLSHHCPPAAPANSAIWRTVRVRAGRQIAGEVRRRLAFRARFRPARAGLLGRLVPPRYHAAGVLPVDVEAGREISVALAMRTPARLGDYLLDIAAGSDLLTTIPLAVGAAEAANAPEVPAGPMIGDYGTDHQHALDVLEEFLGRHFGRPCLMLEVASGVHPHLLRFAVAGHLVVATDICSNMMQLGALSARHHMRQTLETLGFASADAFDMPFRPGQFDVVALFAALHHFPDPVAFLARLKPLLRAGGVLAVMCEPCDPQTTIVSDGYVRDLAAGINEQVFSVEEYRAMFAKAGLVERAIRNDGGSLKAILAPAAAS